MVFVENNFFILLLIYLTHILQWWKRDDEAVVGKYLLSTNTISSGAFRISRGGQPQRTWHQHIIQSNVPKNYMKMKKIRRGVSKIYYADPPLIYPIFAIGVPPSSVWEILDPPLQSPVAKWIILFRDNCIRGTVPVISGCSTCLWCTFSGDFSF